MLNIEDSYNQRLARLRGRLLAPALSGSGSEPGARLPSVISQWMSGVDLVANPNLSEVINAYMHAILSTRPKTRYVCGLDARLLFMPLSFLPSAFQDFILEFLPRLQLAPALIPRATRKQPSYGPPAPVAKVLIDENRNEKLPNGDIVNHIEMLK
uniref:Uncharacterized protein n=1 Tax=Bursaphelenchus xylophilus TaxID=6326 RepID=A0A1I7RXN6_BURXY